MKIEVLYPEICNLYGDLANAEYLSRSCGAELCGTSLGETPKFISEDIALVYMGYTTERGQLLVRDSLTAYRDALLRRIDDGGVTLVTGNAMEVFGEYIESDDGSREEMLGFFPIHAKRYLNRTRYNSLYLGKLYDMDIIGFKSQFGHSYGDNGAGLFTTVRGAGLNPDVMAEGLRRNNFMATYLMGPLTIMNPDFAKYLLEMMGVESPVLAFEEEAVDVHNTRLKEFLEPERGYVY